MAKLVFELNQSLDGYVDHQALGPPDPALFRHFTERVRGLAGMLYGRGPKGGQVQFLALSGFCRRQSVQANRGGSEPDPFLPRKSKGPGAGCMY